MKNKKKILIISSISIFILLLGVLLISNTSSNNNDILEEVNISKNKTFAIMLQNDSGGYVESDSNTFPTSGYELNTTLTNCVDETGTKVEDVLSYEEGNIAVETNKKVYCYLYFDIVAYEQIVNYTMLYDYGDECTDITGGIDRHWQYGGYNGTGTYTFTKNTNNIYTKGSYSSNIDWAGTGFGPVNLLDLSEYTSVSAVLDFKNSSGTAYGGGVSLGNTELGVGTSIGYGTSYDASVSMLSATGNDSAFSVTNYILTLSLDDTKNIESTYVDVRTTGCNCYGESNVYALWLCKKDDYLPLGEYSNITATSINEILNSSSVLLSNENAVKYMIYNCTGDFMISAIQSETFMAALESSPYKDLVYANEHWAKFLAMVE